MSAFEEEVRDRSRACQGIGLDRTADVVMQYLLAEISFLAWSLPSFTSKSRAL